MGYLEYCDVRQKGFVIVDGDVLEGLVHVDGLAHVVECALLAQLHRAPKWNALTVRVVPCKVCIPREQRVDDRLRDIR